MFWCGMIGMCMCVVFSLSAFSAKMRHFDEKHLEGNRCTFMLRQIKKKIYTQQRQQQRQPFVLQLSMYLRKDHAYNAHTTHNNPTKKQAHVVHEKKKNYYYCFQM